MQTLVFNTTTKTVKVLVACYEVMQKDEFDRSRPVLRLPIANTNMVIEN